MDQSGTKNGFWRPKRTAALACGVAASALMASAATAQTVGVPASANGGTLNVVSDGTTPTLGSNVVGISNQQTATGGVQSNVVQGSATYSTVSFSTSVTNPDMSVTTTTITALSIDGGATALQVPTTGGGFGVIEVTADMNSTPALTDDTFRFVSAANVTTELNPIGDATALDTFIANNASATAAGSLTAQVAINNPPAGGVGQSFNTTNASGVVATSTGGAGSNGISIPLLITSINTRGGAGGNGGSVGVANGGVISVDANDFGDVGVLAQSAGGNGGNGGGSFSLIEVAARGGDGGNAGAVVVNLTAVSSITVDAQGGAGVFARSIGGDGGRGGRATAAFAFGSNGGEAGDGSNVTVTNDGRIETSGVAGHGIYAASLGGNGGSGTGADGLVAVGAAGGGASTSGEVRVTNNGTIITRGAQAHGIFAHTVGGGGGDGGSAGGLFAVGGSGASGGDAGALVQVTQAANITTSGDDASGVFAQSVGGGGGDGGGAFSASAFVGVAVGGSGANGGVGKTVDINFNNLGDGSTPTITTSGASSRGVFAQSIGGGGGNGGSATQVSVGAFGAVSVAVGGSGGGGANSGVVTVDGSVDIVTGSGGTSGDGSQGLVAQSIGGGGGAGGASVSIAASAGLGFSGSLAVAVGGSGGSGGAGNTVDIDSGGSIATSGDNATGLLAQSIGGGGGAGGFSVSGAVAVSDTVALTGSIAVGGTGGAGGTGGRVEVDYAGNITTNAGVRTGGARFGDDADGFVAQSIGGGGGAGGFSIAGGLSGAGAASGNVSVGVGGAGSTGGDSGTVDAALIGDVTTQGDFSEGYVAQSIGGGGGSGGYSIAGGLAFAGTGSGAVSVGIGGSGGSAGTAGNVADNQLDVIGDVTGQVRTSGNNAGAIVVQAVGGGGGAGGFAIGGSIAGAGTGAFTTSIGLGGSGGAGGAAGDVSSTLNANTANSAFVARTNGSQSTAIVVQSVGGGGGAGGFSIAGGIAGAGTGAAAVNVGVGGRGGGGGDAGAVTAVVTGAVEALGTESSGVVAQSLGGGGGAGGFNVSAGIAGAGTGAGAVNVGIGGAGGAASSGGAVNLTVNGAVTIGSANANGSLGDAVLAQSIGGGGGAGGFNINGGIAGAGTAGGAIGVGLGGFGGSGGNANTVTLRQQSGAVTTFGDDVNGIVAQSIGGGGGAGGFVVGGSIAGGGTGAGSINVGIGGSGGSGGNASTVDVDVLGGFQHSITGQDSVGLRAQSIGGGGGAGGFSVAGSIAGGGTGGGSVAVGVGGAGGAGGLGGNVDVDVNGSIMTTGARSVGLQAQSIGGSGGAGGFSVTGAIGAGGSGAAAVNVGVGGTGGTGADSGDNLSVDYTGDITTNGVGSDALQAQLIGGGGGAGGFTVGGGIAAANTAAGVVSVGVGGTGGGGGDAFQNAQSATGVTGTFTGNLTTQQADSRGALIQSIGGGGGRGGFNVTGSLSYGNSGSGQVGVGIGGFGGQGGSGGVINYSILGGVRTSGAGSDGVVVQSLGGGGGAGGFNVTAGIAGTGSGTAGGVNVGIGGFGGAGGSSDNVTLVVDGDVVAAGDGVTSRQTIDGVTQDVRAGGASGVIVQSIGGGGGAGGFNISGGVSFSSGSGNAAGVNFGLGGFGGAGGAAGSVNLRVGPALSTTLPRATASSFGDDQSAIIAQSIGGGGGAGGFNIAGGVTTGGGATIGIGGFGGDGATASTVDLVANANVTATGRNARGVLAQSIGGSGGNGGFNISAAVSLTTNTNIPNLAFGLGGAGGSGNTASRVTASQTGTVMVTGVDAMGVVAQSIGGGGGAGGFNVTGVLQLSDAAALGIGVGGAGGSGANAGIVTLNSDGQITVDGRSPDSKLTGGARGIVAQSIGGGGGAGGFNITGLITPDAQAAANVGVGGSGGAAGQGLAVTVNRGQTTPSSITVNGDGAVGLLAQSIGGGGGDAGFNIIASTITNDDNGSFNLNIGGSGGASGASGLVTVNHTGTIITTGANSNALQAQSIAGGGGSGSLNLAVPLTNSNSNLNVAIGGSGAGGGVAGDVVVNHSGAISTTGKDSDAIFAQSIGGGGGSASNDVTVDVFSDNNLGLTLGRLGGSGGNAGNVSVFVTETTSMITTKGADAVGVFAQSVGGGGGDSGTIGLNVAGSGGDSSSALNLSFGLDGGGGGTGGAVRVDSAARIDTEGARAYGVFAQSIGGGGGTGGSANSFDLNPGNTANINIGGGGGAGGLAGRIDVVNSGGITTIGENAHGVWAQSVGGGGGVGGYALQSAASFTGSNNINSFTLGVGGAGGAGSNGGIVNVTNTGTIITGFENVGGKGAAGIFAQSVGGGGGDGGAAISANLTLTQSSQNSLTVNVGGAAGDGGTGGAVTVENQGVITTTGAEAPGIIAQSIGGSGGDGGAVYDVSLSANGGGSSSNDFDVNIGGGGGGGGVGGAVIVRNRPDPITNVGMAQITTSGAKSYGIQAQSIGGGGGNGGLTVTGAVSTATTNTVTAGLTLGGRGGAGNNGGLVTVINEGSIRTSGAEAHGVFAQSIGGGGGNGGFAIAAGGLLTTRPGSTYFLAVGGGGGDGGDGGDVVVTNSGTITTASTAKGADGIFAQSIGGGGGTAGVSLTLSGSGANGAIGTSIGNLIGALSTGAQGNQGAVTVNQTGTVMVQGEGARAIRADGVSGGGGVVTFDVNGISTQTGLTSSSTINTKVGSLNAVSAVGPTVQSMHMGDAVATGMNGVAASALSVGGGGGVYNETLNFIDQTNPGVFNSQIQLGDAGSGNNGGIASSQQTGAVMTSGINGVGALAQSIGGGGGNTTVTVTGMGGGFGVGSFTLGATNVSSSVGGAATRDQTGDVTTTADFGAGVIVQSIGGGGGVATFVDMTDAATNAQYTATLGSNGGAGNNGGVATSKLVGQIDTAGSNATGVVVQSIGGGGGLARIFGGDQITANLGGTNGASGNGSTARVDHNGAVTTLGFRAHAVFAQSIGGGGGAVFHNDTTPTPVLKYAPGSGAGGTVDVDLIGSVFAAGQESFGIFAQSVGGGGGYVDGLFFDATTNTFNGTAAGAGSGGMVAVTHSGNIVTPGAGSVPIFAQSVGGSGGMAIDVDVDGVIAGGTGDIRSVAAIILDGGDASNTVDMSANSFIIGGNNQALIGGSGGETVTSLGDMVGNVNLGGGANSLTNRGTFRTLTTIDLGAPANVFTNDGVLIPGYELIGPDLYSGGVTEASAAALTKGSFTFRGNRAQQTDVNGAFQATANSQFFVDTSFSLTPTTNRDLITTTGFGTINGVVTPTLFTLETATTPVTIIDVAPTAARTDAGATVTDTVVIDYSIGLDGPQGDGSTIDLVAAVDFSLPGFTRNQTEVGDHINNILNGDGSASLGPLFAFIGNMTDPDMVQDTIDRLTIEGYAGTRLDTMFASRDFLDTMVACDQLTTPTLTTANGHCLWFTGEGRAFQRDSSTEYKGVQSETYRISGGAHIVIDEEHRVGAAGGFEAVDLEVGPRHASQGDRGHFGVYYQNVGHMVDFTLAATGSTGAFDTFRRIGIDGFIAEDLPFSIGTATADERVSSATFRFSAERTYAPSGDSFYIRPRVNLDATYLLTHGFDETGAGAAGVSVEDTDQWLFSANPQIEFGATFGGDDGGVSVTPFARFGGVFYSDDETYVDAAFIGAPASAGTFRNYAGFDQAMGQITTGFRLEHGATGLNLSIDYDGLYGGETTQHSGRVSFGVKF